MKNPRPLAFADHLSVPRRPLGSSARAMLALLAGTALILFLANCAADPNTATAGGCAADSECSSGVCVQGQCQECRQDAQCGDGALCKGNRCEMAVAAATCDCGPGETCDASGACMADESLRASSSSDLPVACRSGAGASNEIALNLITFEFNEASLTSDSQRVLEANAECLRARPKQRVLIEGHCDERGTQEFNLALGERRAATVKSFLVNLGVEAHRIRTLSKGENQPVCEATTDDCYQRNRRAEFRLSDSDGPSSRGEEG